MLTVPAALSPGTVYTVCVPLNRPSRLIIQGSGNFLSLVAEKTKAQNSENTSSSLSHVAIEKRLEFSLSTVPHELSRRNPGMDHAASLSLSEP